MPSNNLETHGINPEPWTDIDPLTDETALRILYILDDARRHGSNGDPGVMTSTDLAAELDAARKTVVDRLKHLAAEDFVDLTVDRRRVSGAQMPPLAGYITEDGN